MARQRCRWKTTVKPGQRVLVVDDLLATGGTIGATVDMVEQMGGKVVGAAFLIELKELEGRKHLRGIDTKTLMEF